MGQTEGHHQDERSIAAYLTFKYPEQHTFYKASFYSKYCKLLGINKAKVTERYPHYLSLIDDFITNYIAPDSELIDQVKSLIPDYYDGTNHKLLAQDILFQMLDLQETPPKTTATNTCRYWLYAPGENASKWDEFHEQGIMGLDWDELGDLTELGDKKAITAAIKSTYQTDNNPTNLASDFSPFS